MAKQKGIIKLAGTIGDISFYKSKDGYLAREKGGVEADRIKNDPAFARTRENGQEFGMAAKAGKLLRDAARPLMMRAADNRAVSRITKLMSDIRKLDDVSPRGERTVGVAIANQAAKDLLNGLNFNNRATLSSILFHPYTLDNSTGNITIVDINMLNDVVAPRGATHVAFTSAWGKIDFVTGEFNVELSNTTNSPITNTLSTLALAPAQAPSGTGTDVFFFMIEFFQELNGSQYSLNNGQYNALSIIDVV